MSQDSTLGVQANAAGAAFRASLNVSLAAIISQYSGTSTPTTTVAYMLWADTTTGLLKQRDSSNATWIVIGTMGAAYLGLLSLAGGQMTGALNEALGSPIASAATVNLTAATGNGVHVTGTTAITAVTLGAGMHRTVVFDGILTLTHHATNNNLPGAANITTAVGDRALYWSDGTTVYCLAYLRADGSIVALATAGSDPTYADNSTKAASTNWIRAALYTIATAAGFVANFSPNGYIKFPSWFSGFVIQWGSVTTNGAGYAAITFPVAFPNACRSITSALTSSGVSGFFINFNTMSTTSVNCAAIGAGGSGTYATPITWIAVGY